jgi:tetratricopeptide (TPR) repeat protein
MGRIVDEFLERLGRGERPEVEEYARRYPQLATVLRHMLPAVQVIHYSDASHPRPAAGPAPEIEPEGPLGDFRIVREIGRGGMGIVYEAVQISLGRRVALKVLPFAAALDARQLQRFQNEAQAAAHLHHQGIVPVHSVGCERGVHFYAMQLIEGRTLAEVIDDLRSEAAGAAPREASAPGPPEAVPDTSPVAGLSTAPSSRQPEFFRTAARLGLQAAEALEHAHQEGIVHRDVKPANLLVDARGHLWVTDFGLARLQGETGLTVSGDLLGTLRYMSPEQALGRPSGVDQRTDVYALGATLYELLALRPVFEGRDRQELLRRIAAEEPRPPRRLNPAIPAELEVIVLKALEKDAASRYATAQELADDLRRFLEDQPIRARRPSWLDRARKWARRHRPVVWSAGVVLLVTLAVLGGSAGWIVRDRAARRARIATDVQAALAEARRFQKEGRWPEGQAAARRAEALLASGGGDPELQQSVRTLLADLRMVAQLEDIRILRSSVKDGYFNAEGADRAYAAAFRNDGIDVEALDSREAARRLRARAIRIELAAALDGWAETRRWLPRQGRKSWRELLAVARAADPDPWRRSLRDTVLRGEPELVRRAAAGEVLALPPVTLVLLAECLAGMGRPRQATALLRRAQEQHPGDFWINHQLAQYLGRMRPPQGEEAIRFYTAAVALRPESAGARLNLGVALARRGRREEALTAFRQAIQRKRDYAQAHCNLGQTLREMGRPAEAVTALRQAIALKSDLAEAHGNLGIALVDQGRPEEAAAAFRKAIEFFAGRRALEFRPELVLSHVNLGIALCKGGRLDEGIAAFRQAIALQPDSALAYNHLGQALTARGRLDEAVAAYHRAIALRPAYAEAHCNLGVALVNQGRRDEAVAAYRRAIRLQPTLLPAHHNLGRALEDSGRLDEAVAAYRRVVALNPADADAHYDLGNALREQGRLDEAVAAYRRVIALKPDYAEAYCNLGCTLRRQGRFAQALTALQRGHELGSRRPGWPYTSALWVKECRRLGELEGRLRAFLRGEAQPASAAERNLYALYCHDQRRYLAAARLWRGAFAADPKLADDLEAGYRHAAACAAARAGFGQGADAGQLDDQERRRWRRQALQWLRADLAAYSKLLAGGQAEDRRLVRRRLRGWQSERDLVGLRDPTAVARLPADEQQACRQLWAEVVALLSAAAVK